MIKLKKINNAQVSVIPVTKVNLGTIKGADIIPYLYTNIYIVAQKRSGKTNVIFKIIQSCISKDTTVIVFCSTHNNDENWKFIKDYLEKKIPSMFFSSLHEDDETGKEVDQLEELRIFMTNELAAEEIEKMTLKEKPSDFIQVVKFDNETNSSKLKIKKPKQKVPKYLIIFDDMSIDLKQKQVPFLLKTFRHYKSKVIVSSQNLFDLAPDARQQFDIWLLFGGHPYEKLEKVYGDIDLNYNFNVFYNIYKQVTSQKYNFLYIDKNTKELRKNFSELIEIPHLSQNM